MALITHVGDNRYTIAALDLPAAPWPERKGGGGGGSTAATAGAVAAAEKGGPDGGGGGRGAGDGSREASVAGRSVSPDPEVPLGLP